MTRPTQLNKQFGAQQATISDESLNVDPPGLGQEARSPNVTVDSILSVAYKTDSGVQHASQKPAAKVTRRDTMNVTAAFTFLAVLYAAVGVVKNRRRKRAHLPRVGRAGPLGYVWAVLRSILDSDGLVEEGWAKFGGKPFVLPSMTGEWIVLGPDDAEQFRKSDDTVFNAPKRLEELFLPNVMFGNITANPYHLITIIRSDLTKALRSLVPGMLEEAQLAIPEHIPIKIGETSTTISLFSTMVHLIARVSNRAMIGAPGCRDEKFLKNQVAVAEEVIPMSQVLNWFPAVLQPAVWKLFCVTIGAKDRAVRFVSPYLKARVEYAQQDNPSTDR
ncbi:hypothetical protein C8F01DRAFT_481817 [Mycena amicta]|nr:hypothetical protein C8F01DRAFT_481817 [Mycena amicta]